MRYKSEVIAKGLSIQAFCSVNNIPYNGGEPRTREQANAGLRLGRIGLRLAMVWERGDGSSHCVRAMMIFLPMETGLRADFYTFNLIFGEFFVYLRAL